MNKVYPAIRKSGHSSVRLVHSHCHSGRLNLVRWSRIGSWLRNKSKWTIPWMQAIPSMHTLIWTPRSCRRSVCIFSLRLLRLRQCLRPILQLILYAPGNLVLTQRWGEDGEFVFALSCQIFPTSRTQIVWSDWIGLIALSATAFVLGFKLFNFKPPDKNCLYYFGKFASVRCCDKSCPRVDIDV